MKKTKAKKEYVKAKVKDDAPFDTLAFEGRSGKVKISKKISGEISTKIKDDKRSNHLEFLN